MKVTLKIVLTQIGFFICLAQFAFGQIPNFSGTWKLNFEKSSLEYKPDGLIRTVFIIKQDSDKFRLTRYHIFGDKKKKISFRMVADGKARRLKILFKGKLEQIENGLKATLWRKNFLNIVDYKFRNNQNEFIANEVFTGKPQNHHNIWVFDREITAEDLPQPMPQMK